MAQAGAGSGQVSVHHVRSGETMGAIAHDHGVGLHALLQANPQIANPNVIRPGQMVHLPKGAHAHGPGHAHRHGAPHAGGAAGARHAATQHPAAQHAESAPKQTKTTPPPVNASSPCAGVSAAGFAFIYGQEHVDGISEHLHWPKGSSGVTLGSGYDMRNRSGPQIVRELTAVGVPSDQASAAAGGSRLTGEDARIFAANNRSAITLTRDQESRLLAMNMRDAVTTVAQTVRVPLTQNQHDALVSLVFNIGDPHFRSSTVLRKLNAGDYAGAAEAMAMWNKSGGKVSPVLVRRRTLEMAMFNRPDASGPRGTMPAVAARQGAPLKQGGAAPGGASGGGRFGDIVRRRGASQATSALDAGKLVIVGVRTATSLDVNRGHGSYDDTMAIVRKTGSGVEAATFRCNTEPSTQYLYRKAPPDVNGDGRPDLGQIESGQTIHYTLGTFLKHEALKADGSRMVRVRRDVNHNNRMDASDPVSSIAGAGGMHIHIGGASNTYSAGCQTLPPEEHSRFFGTLHRWNNQQKDFWYVIVDAPG